MKTDHLSSWEQEEYLLGERIPQTLRHLGECTECRAAVDRLDQGVTAFRTAAVEWSSECLATRPQRLQTFSARRLPRFPLRWAFAAVIPLLLLLLALLPLAHLSSPRAARPVAQISNSDDALLDHVDEQVSAAVPSSMESLTHLVSTGNSSGPVTSARGSRHIVRTN
jgi:hypothetical protein